MKRGYVVSKEKQREKRREYREEKDPERNERKKYKGSWKVRETQPASRNTQLRAAVHRIAVCVE